MCLAQSKYSNFSFLFILILIILEVNLLEKYCSEGIIIKIIINKILQRTEILDLATFQNTFLTSKLL